MVNGQWWFTTREGEQGPYHSREAADQDVQRYAEMMDTTDQQEMEMERAIPDVEGSVNEVRSRHSPNAKPSPPKRPGDGGRLLDSLFRD